jgi:hypothetical protein
LEILALIVVGAAVLLITFIAALPKGVGVWGYLRHVRAARRGALAEAKILSASYEPVYAGGRTTYELRRNYSLIYEVCPPGEPPFRAKGFEMMDSVEAETNRLHEGATVQVRVDAKHEVVVLMRIPSETRMQRLNREERERNARQEAKEEELLRGGPKG